MQDRAKRCQGARALPSSIPLGRRRKEPESEGTLGQRCARLGAEVETLKQWYLGDGSLGSRRKHEIAKLLKRESSLSTLLELIGMLCSTTMRTFPLTGGRHEALLFVCGGPLQRRGRLLESIPPSMKMVFVMLAILEGRFDGGNA